MEGELERAGELEKRLREGGQIRKRQIKTEGRERGRGRAEGGARGAGRPTPNCAVAASSAELLGSPARRLLNELRGHPRPPTFQFHGPRSAREMQPVPDAGKARGAGGWEQGSRSKLRGARCGARGGPLSPR